MPSLISLLLAISITLTSTYGTSVPGKIPLARRSHQVQVPRTLQEPAFQGDITASSEKRDILVERQICSAGSMACSGGGCCSGACCGDGCCPSGYTCRYVGSQSGCCPVGQTCSNTISGCVIPGDVQCTNYNFCCPLGQFCYLDSLNGSACGSGSPGHSNIGTTTSLIATTSTTVAISVRTTTVVAPPSNPTYMPSSPSNTPSTRNLSVDSIGVSTTTMAVFTTAGQIKPDLVSPTKEGGSGGDGSVTQISGTEAGKVIPRIGRTASVIALLGSVCIVSW